MRSCNEFFEYNDQEAPLYMTLSAFPGGLLHQLLRYNSPWRFMLSPEAVPVAVGATEIGGAEPWNEPQTVALGFSACKRWSESEIMYDVIPMVDRGQFV